jgi:hypothetical protein
MYRVAIGHLDAFCKLAEHTVTRWAAQILWWTTQLTYRLLDFSVPDQVLHMTSVELLDPPDATVITRPPQAVSGPSVFLTILRVLHMALLRALWPQEWHRCIAQGSKRSLQPDDDAAASWTPRANFVWLWLRGRPGLVAIVITPPPRPTCVCAKDVAAYIAHQPVHTTVLSTSDTFVTDFVHKYTPYPRACMLTHHLVGLATRAAPMGWLPSAYPIRFTYLSTDCTFVRRSFHRHDIIPWFLPGPEGDQPTLNQLD